MDVIPLIVLIASLVAFSCAIPLYLIPRVIRRAPEWGILDLPDDRKVHEIPTPRLGGLSLIPSLWIGCTVTLLLTLVFKVHKFGLENPSLIPTVVGLLIGGTGVFLLGCVDDIKRLAASQKLVCQAGIAALTLNFLPIPSSLFGIAIDPLLMSLILFVWLVIIPNSVNILDGIDGLTGTVSILFLSALGVLSVLNGHTGWLLILTPLAASIVAFLKFNWQPARIFLGDSGSLLIGFVVAYLSLIFAITPSSSESIAQLNWNPIVSIGLTSIWVFDTFLAVGRRYWTKRPPLKIYFKRSRTLYWAFQGDALANIMRPDRKHIHHRLVDLGLSVPRAVLEISLFSMGGFVLAIALGGSSWLGPLQPTALAIAISIFAISIAAIALRFTRRAGQAINGSSSRSNWKQAA